MWCSESEIEQIFGVDIADPEVHHLLKELLEKNT